MGLCAIGETEAEVAERTDNALGRMKNMAANEEAQAAFRASPAIGMVDALVERLRAYEAVGVTRVYLQLIDRSDLASIALMGKVARALH
jgi:hypothetical protein